MALLTPTPVPEPERSLGALRIVALGDSLTRGAGDAAGSSEVVGYPARLAARLRTGTRGVEVQNLAVDGTESSELARFLRRPEVSGRLRTADLILMSIGGNDLTHALRGAIAEDPDRARPLEEARTRLRANLAEILGSMRRQSQTAPIRILGLYDPSGEGVPDRGAVRLSLVSWNAALEETALSYPGARFVPIADLFDDRPDRLSQDRFHPSALGYDEIAARVLSTVPQSLYRPSREAGHP